VRLRGDARSLFCEFPIASLLLSDVTGPQGRALVRARSVTHRLRKARGRTRPRPNRV
jgi:hypothetical protein